MKRTLILLLLACSLSLRGLSQGYICIDNLPFTSLKDNDGHRRGKGGMVRYSGNYTFSLPSPNWRMTLSASYAAMDNTGEASLLNPDEMLNASVTFINVKPLSKRWSRIATIGGGVYADLDEVDWGSLVAVGSLTFAYRLNPHTSIGVGGGVTTTYGVPVVLPMFFLQWAGGGEWRVTASMKPFPDVRIVKPLGEAVRLELTAIEMEAMSATMRVVGKQRTYSTMMLRSAAELSVKLSPKMSFYGGVGSVWRRTSRLTRRSYGGFFDNFDFSQSNRYHFGTALRLSAGFRYGL